MTEVALQAVELVRRIEGTVTHTLVNGIDLAVNKGEFVAITGPSGSGKSSLLYSLGLAEHANKRPNQLSGGQRQRVAIARALANRPEIIVADEPTGALDTASTEQVFSILRDIADQGQTVVVVTHDPALAARADRRIHIVDGKIAEITERGGGELVCAAGS